MTSVTLVRGAGDLATGVILHLHRCGFHVLAVECERPSAIRRRAALCEAVYDGAVEVEGTVCRRIESTSEMEQCWLQGEVPLLVDESLSCLDTVQPAALVDAILAKENLGTHRAMAPITVALGPGFTAGEDTDAVIETMRGHDLGRVLYRGAALPNTGVPGVIGGESQLRVIHAPADGRLVPCAAIGDIVETGQTIALLDETPVVTSLTGVLRGLIRTDYPVKKGLKIADVDPRLGQQKNCYTVSDKARCIAGGVVEALFTLSQKREVSLL